MLANTRHTHRRVFSGEGRIEGPRSSADSKAQRHKIAEAIASVHADNAKSKESETISQPSSPKDDDDLHKEQHDENELGFTEEQSKILVLSEETTIEETLEETNKKRKKRKKRKNLPPIHNDKNGHEIAWAIGRFIFPFEIGLQVSGNSCLCFLCVNNSRLLLIGICDQGLSFRLFLANTNR
jgi:hypothetical protein